MEEHVYDGLQVKVPVKKTTVKRCLFIWIGVIIGSIISGIIVFSAVKYGGSVSYDGSSCLWTEWTEWTGCNSILVSGKEKRVQIYTGYAHSCQQKEIAETRICIDRILDIRFDPTTLYSARFLSRNYKVLSNKYTGLTPYNPNARSRFQNYQGAMLSKCVEHSTSIYYEIYFKYALTSNLTDGPLVLELGIGERNKIDNSFYVGNSNVSGWSFFLYNCILYNKICLMAEHQSIGIRTVNLFSNNTKGTIVNGTFAMLIDRERNKFSLFYNDTLLFTFHDVLSNVSLCPVFGVYNPESVEVDLQIVSVGDMTLTF